MGWRDVNMAAWENQKTGEMMVNKKGMLPVRNGEGWIGGSQAGSPKYWLNFQKFNKA